MTFMFSGDNAFPSAHNLMYGGDAKCKEDNIDRMVNDLEKQYVISVYKHYVRLLPISSWKHVNFSYRKSPQQFNFIDTL